MIRTIYNKYSLQELFDDDKLYKEKIEKLHNDEQFEKYFSTLNIPLHSKNILINIPVSGELVFECDRRIWQSFILDKYICNVDCEKEIKIGKIARFMKYYQKSITVNEEYANTRQLIINNEVVKIDLVYSVIEKYLKYLSKKEYIQKYYKIIDKNTVFCKEFGRTVMAQFLYGFHDRYYDAWYKCVKCGEIKRDYEFYSVNNIYGICNDCYRKGDLLCEKL